MAYGEVREYVHRLPFDSAAWKDRNQAESDDPVRIRMVDDLINSKQLNHLSRTDLETILGKPTASNYFRDYDLVYWLGPERAFMGIDSEWLAIKLHKSGFVSSYKIVSD
jgi:hypothetical protein